MKWGIVNCHNGKVEQVYESETSQQDSMGGPWGSSNMCEHIQLVEAAEDADKSTLEVVEMMIEVGTQMVPDGEPRQALDNEGEPMVDADNNPIMVQDHIEQPVMELQKRIVIQE